MVARMLDKRGRFRLVITIWRKMNQLLVWTMLVNRTVKLDWLKDSLTGYFLKFNNYWSITK